MNVQEPLEVIYEESLIWSLCSPSDLKSLLQHHNSKAWIFHCSAFFMVQLSHPYMTTGKTKALTMWTSVSKVMFLLYNTLSRFFIIFLPRRRHLTKSVIKYRFCCVFNWNVPLPSYFHNTVFWRAKVFNLDEVTIFLLKCSLRLFFLVFKNSLPNWQSLRFLSCFYFDVT